MLANPGVDIVIKAGVGIPSGVTGMPDKNCIIRMKGAQHPPATYNLSTQIFARSRLTRSFRDLSIL